MPDGITIGPLKIYFYGIIIMVGVLAAVWVAIKEAERRELDSENVWDIVPWLLILGIVGARLWHVFTPSQSMGVGPEYYFAHPLEILNTRNGGLGIPGAVIGGLLALLIYTKRKGLNFLTWADIIVPGLALAQAVGRWGNFFNQELYGPPSSLPWAIYIDPAHRLAGYEEFSRFHPMFLYESIWNLFNFFLLMFLGRAKEDKLLPGDLLYIYLIVYPVGRFLLEFIRLDASYVGGVNVNQIIMACVAVFATWMLIFNHLRARRQIADGEMETAVETLETDSEDKNKEA
ncbi:prolipoprotein diacylglyceryl transferase [Pelolinea submarina]|uniref:Phosphatidylglycerol--prolipoprotein diacylglyceryl transferase n=1 Tax=Pelolinea submarina TaxID=913107 RepID=A0A347ZSB1_9CHLR|nr:prolipoprotein diacylglyceryl transferase [Pelolinea submarina]REG11242.1 prolipoprotein diacylglyceryl transferase [Pelolinea submarina]BBB48192.1 phosphatidylglycerol:prolipoprotein diacylglycerol transferase [Pelolinea submarina]